MKKYNKPELSIIEMEVAQVVAASLTDGNAVNFTNEYSDSMDASRRRGVSTDDYSRSRD